MRMKLFLMGAQRSALFGVFVLAMGGTLMGAPATEAGTLELTGMFGAAANLPNVGSIAQTAINQLGVSGFTVSNGSSFKWFGGGSVGVAVAPAILLVGETNYNYAGQANVSHPAAGSSLNFSTKLTLLDFTGGAHIQLRVRSTKFAPYVAAAAGGVRISAVDSGAGLPANLSASSTNFTYNFGGGVRYRIGKSWGIRPDARWVRIPGQNYVRFGVGFFWQSKS